MNHGYGWLKYMPKRRRIQRYGWCPDLPDNRDKVFESLKIGHIIPDRIDMRDRCPEVVDQGILGSCTACAISSAFQFEQMRQSKASWQPSRLMLYYNERDLEGTTDFDSGAQLRDGIKSLVNQGICPETMWPYDIMRFTERPPQEAYTVALGNQAISYRRIGSLKNSMIECLAMGLPFVFGFTVFSSFESNEVAQTGILKMPGKDESIVGGHAVMAVGYDQPAKQFIIRNSWGKNWGKNGYFFMPMDYLTDPNLCDDRWVISRVE